MPTVINGSTGITTKKVAAEEMGTVGGDDVVASGSNSDGEWTKCADGTQWAQGIGEQTIDIDGSSSYGGYLKLGGAINYPVAFLTTPNVVASSQENPVSVGVNYAASDETQWAPAFRSIVITRTAAKYSYQAKGRWKA